MQIQKSGKANDLFLDELKKRMTVAKDENPSTETPMDEQLADERKDKDEKAEADAPFEGQLKEVRKDSKEEPALYEKMLEEHRKAEASVGVTEKLLNDDSQDGYPHRNPDAYERTGDKRPINALPEELGNASDDAKRTRYEKANTSGDKRALDKDVGSQKTIKAFNLRQTKEACYEYLSYKAGGIKAAASEKFAEVRNLDEVMAGILEKAQDEKRDLSQDEIARIFALKQRKSEILGIK